MKKTPLRSEIANEDKWKIEDLYRTDESWESDYNKCLEIAETDCEYKGRLSESADNFYNALKESDDVDYLIERVYVYAFMKYYEDTANPKYQELSGKAQMAAVKLSEKYSFMMPEILSMDEKVIEDFLKDERIAMYRNAISDILVKKEHSLSEKEERLLAMAGQMSSSPNEIFSKFNNADARFGFIKDEDGNMVELTNGKYSVFMESNDRRVRMDAFKALYKEYGDYINTLSAVYYANVRQAVFFAQARKYSSTLEMYLSGSFIPVSVYKNLIATVNKNLDKMHRYVSLRKKELGVDELHLRLHMMRLKK